MEMRLVDWLNSLSLEQRGNDVKGAGLVEKVVGFFGRNQKKSFLVAVEAGHCSDDSENKRRGRGSGGECGRWSSADGNIPGMVRVYSCSVGCDDCSVGLFADRVDEYRSGLGRIPWSGYVLDCC